MKFKSGDDAIVIEGALGKTGPNVGKRVKIGNLQGLHTKYGKIWKVHGSNLITEYGVVGTSVDCSEHWLKKIDPNTSKTKSKLLEMQE